MAKKKMKWNSSNPLYRWKMKQSKKPSKSKRTKKPKGVVNMVKRRKSRAKGKSYGTNKLMRGILPIGGLATGLLAGMAISALNKKLAPQVVPYQGKIVAGLVGGLPAVAGAFAEDMLSNKSTSSSGGVVYY